MNDLIGIRDEDLTQAERRERDRLALADPDDLDFANLLADTLPALAHDEAAAPSLETVLDSRRGNRHWSWGVSGLVAIAAAAALWVGVAEAPTQRDKGIGSLPIRLAAVAEGPLGTRALSSGASVSSAESVVFMVQAQGSGALTLYEGKTVIHPATGEWMIEAGEHVPGGEQPLAWRPDRPLDSAVYRAELCNERGCTSDTLRLRWTSR